MSGLPKQFALVALVAAVLVSGCATVGGTADNPWGKENVTVGVADPEGVTTDRHVRMVENTTEYWEGEGAQYHDHKVNFVVAPNATDTDVVVTFHPELHICDWTYYGEGIAGCAPLLNDSTRVTETVHIDVSIAVADGEVEATLKHEMGHVLGLNHSSEPQGIMSGKARPAPR